MRIRRSGPATSPPQVPAMPGRTCETEQRPRAGLRTRLARPNGGVVPAWEEACSAPASCGRYPNPQRFALPASVLVLALLTMTASFPCIDDGRPKPAQQHASTRLPVRRRRPVPADLVRRAGSIDAHPDAPCLRRASGAGTSSSGLSSTSPIRHPAPAPTTSNHCCGGELPLGFRGFGKLYAYSNSRRSLNSGSLTIVTLTQRTVSSGRCSKSAGLISISAL
jgi:hypothetical protein